MSYPVDLGIFAKFMIKKSSIKLFERACEILKSRGIEPVRHFSPYAEGGEYISGSALQIFWDAGGIEYRLLFNGEGELVSSNL